MFGKTGQNPHNRKVPAGGGIGDILRAAATPFPGGHAPLEPAAAFG